MSSRWWSKLRLLDIHEADTLSRSNDGWVIERNVGILAVNYLLAVGSIRLEDVQKLHTIVIVDLWDWRRHLVP
jgi:hypothetical protein